MNVLTLQIFVSLVLVAGSIVLFAFSVRQRDFDHADRLSLAPLEADPVPAHPGGASPAKPTAGGSGSPPPAPDSRP